MFRRIETNDSLAILNAAYHGMTVAGLPQERERSCLHRRPKFFFTEEGWKRFGHRTLSEVRAAGLHARITAVKEHRRNQLVVYRDRWQVCIVFRKKYATRTTKLGGAHAQLLLGRRSPSQGK